MKGETRDRGEVENKNGKRQKYFWEELGIVSSSVVWNKQSVLCPVHSFLLVSSSIICDFGVHPTLK